MKLFQRKETAQLLSFQGARREKDDIASCDHGDVIYKERKKKKESDHETFSPTNFPL